MREADILIVGGGPAGATAALNLAPTHRVILVEVRSEQREHIGESLPSAARHLLGDMGLLDAFLLQGHAPWHGNRAVWGGSIPIENDFLWDLNGHGWHLDRARFDNWLREVSVKRGATLITPARLQKVERSGSRWAVSLNTGEELRASLLIDASGRGASLARRLGARVLVDDHLTCRWVAGDAAGSLGVTIVEAVEDGWWYTAPMPLRRRVLAFHSGHGLTTRSSRVLLQRVAGTLEVSRILKEGSFVPHVGERVIPAFSAALNPCVGDAWLAAGDAALSFDPISSQGLLNALFTGLAAAEAAARSLSGDSDALWEYAQTIAGIRARYRRQLCHWYRLETRWPKSPFWHERCLASQTEPNAY